MEENLRAEKLSPCRACGSSPAAHVPTYISSTADAWLNDRVKTLPAVASLFAYTYRIAHRIEPSLLRLVFYISGRKIYTDHSKAITNRALVLWDEAERRGIKMEQIAIFGKPSECFRFAHDGGWTYFESLVIPSQKNARSYTWLDDKYLFKRFLQSVDVPVARAIMTTSIQEAGLHFETFKSPVVVKPRIGSRARHTTTNVRTLEEFETAFRSAQQMCRYVLFEEHLDGKLCRATLVGGKIVGFLRKSYPAVTGDGIQTIRELVKKKNATKPLRVSDVFLDEDNIEYLKRQGFIPDDVVPIDITIEISPNSGRTVGGDTCEMPADIHPKLRAHLERISRILDVPIIGYDLIIPDPSEDPDNQKWGILEANTLPFIDLHYNPLYGNTSNVAGAVWDFWESTRTQS